jgi:hypothetical protein
LAVQGIAEEMSEYDMKLTSDAGDFVELEVVDLQSRDVLGAPDLALAVRLSRGGFTGDSKAWIDRRDWSAFVQALTILEDRRLGEASVKSMSPNELNLTVRSLDRLGHLGIEGLVGTRRFDGEITLRFSAFSFDPGQLAPFVREAERI